MMNKETKASHKTIFQVQTYSICRGYKAMMEKRCTPEILKEAKKYYSIFTLRQRGTMPSITQVS